MDMFNFNSIILQYYHCIRETILRGDGAVCQPIYIIIILILVKTNEYKMGGQQVSMF